MRTRVSHSPLIRCDPLGSDFSQEKSRLDAPREALAGAAAMVGPSEAPQSRDSEPAVRTASTPMMTAEAEATAPGDVQVLRCSTMTDREGFVSA